MRQYKKLQPKKNHHPQASKLTTSFEAPKMPQTLVRSCCRRGENSTSVGGRSASFLTLESYPPEAIKVGDLFIPLHCGWEWVTSAVM